MLLLRLVYFSNHLKKCPSGCQCSCSKPYHHFQRPGPRWLFFCTTSLGWLFVVILSRWHMCYLGVGLFGASLPFGPRFLHHFQTMTLEHVGPVERALWLLCSLRWSLFPEVVRIHNFSKHVVYLYFVDYCVLSLCLHITVSRIDDVYQTHQVHPSDNIRETSEKRAPQSWEGLIPGPRGPS